MGGKMKYVRENIELQNKVYRLHRWMPDVNNFKGMIQVIHGMAEHVNRYSEFAEYFTERGFIVFGIDHLGHGETVKLNNGTFGYFAEDYSLTMYALEEGGKEPTPKKIAEMIEFAKENDYKVIFYQAEIDSSQTEAFANEIGGKAMQLDPLSPDYLNNLREMGQIFLEVLRD